MLSQRLAPYLKPLLLLDAVSCMVFAIALLGAGPVISGQLAIPEPWLFHGGIICAASAVLGLWLATRNVVSVKGVFVIATANVLWGLVSMAAVLVGWISPTPLGGFLTIAQGVAVLMLGELEFFAARGQSQRNGFA